VNVARILRARDSCGSGSFKAKLIVHLPLLGVGQYVVGFLHLLELFFRGFVAGVKVGMIFTREFPVGLPDFFLRGLAGDAQQFVVVLFASRCHRVSVTSDW